MIQHDRVNAAAIIIIMQNCNKIMRWLNASDVCIHLQTSHNTRSWSWHECRCNMILSATINALVVVLEIRCLRYSERRARSYTFTYLIVQRLQVLTLYQCFDFHQHFMSTELSASYLYGEGKRNAICPIRQTRRHRTQQQNEKC